VPQIMILYFMFSRALLVAWLCATLSDRSPVARLGLPGNQNNRRFDFNWPSSGECRSLYDFWKGGTGR